MSQKRKDHKGRILKTGESQRKDGLYMYRYQDVFGERQCIYSWKLTEFDKTPKGKKDDISLREKEEEINLMLKSGKSVQAKKITLNELFDIYLLKKRRKGKPLAPRTKNNYRAEWNKNIRNTVLSTLHLLPKRSVLTASLTLSFQEFITEALVFFSPLLQVRRLFPRMR